MGKKLSYEPYVHTDDRGRYIAGIVDSDGKAYTINPLGKAHTFSVKDHADRLAEGHARIATETGLDVLPNAVPA